MDQTICDRCKEPIGTKLERHFLRTEEIRTRAFLSKNPPTSYQIAYDLCPTCKALFLDFMEGEAIPPCRKSPES